MKSKMEQVADEIGTLTGTLYRDLTEKKALEAHFQLLKAGWLTDEQATQQFDINLPSLLPTAEEMTQRKITGLKLQIEHATKEDWTAYVECVQGDSRLQAFLDVHSHLSDEIYWGLLGHVWRTRVATVGVWRCGTARDGVLIALQNDIWKLLWLNPRAGREAFMRTDEDRRIYSDLPDELKLYRGYGPENREGFYYSLNPYTAIGFAVKRGGDYDIKIAPKRDCFYVGGFLSEIIYVPGMGDNDQWHSGSNPLPDLMDIQTSAWLTVNEAAQYLSIKPRTLAQWARQGNIKGYVLSGTRRHVWRFLRSDLDARLTAPAVLSTMGGLNERPA